MAKRVYSISFSNSTLTAAMPVFFINPKANGAGSGVRILSIRLSQSGSTTSAQERLQLYTQVSTFPTMVSATPASMQSDDPASGITGGTAGAAGTAGVTGTAAGGGTKTPILADAFNVLNGWLYVPVPEERPEMNTLATVTGMGLWFPAGPATLTGWSGTLVYEEI